MEEGAVAIDIAAAPFLDSSANDHPNVEIPMDANITEDLVDMIESYIWYYNNERLQRNLGILTPAEKHNLYLAA